MIFSISQTIFICFALLKLVSCSPKEVKGSDGRIYLIETDQKYNWFQAWHECACRDMQLLSIDSEAKNNVIIELLKHCLDGCQNLWLGGNDEYNTYKNYNRPFYWSASGEKFNFTNWSYYNPNNGRGQEHCAHIWGVGPNYQWNDFDCTAQMGFICEPNRFYDKYEKDLKENCDASAQLKSEVQENIKTARTAVKDFLKEQQKGVKNLTDQFQKLINKLKKELEESAACITEELESLETKTNNLKDVCS